MTHHACLALPFCYVTSIRLFWPFTINFSNASFVCFLPKFFWVAVPTATAMVQGFLFASWVIVKSSQLVPLPSSYHTHKHACRHLSTSPCPPPFILCRPQPLTRNKRPHHNLDASYFFKIFIYVCICFWLHQVFAWVSVCGSLSCCRAQAPECAGLSSCGT